MVLVFGVTWIATAAVFRYSSLAALVAMIVTPIALRYFGYAQASELFILLSLISIAKHHENIRRLLRGDESKIGDKA